MTRQCSPKVDPSFPNTSEFLELAIWQHRRSYQISLMVFQPGQVIPNRCRPNYGDLEHISAYLSALVKTLFLIESPWVLRSWKIVPSTKSSYGSHQICNSFSTIAEIIKQGVGMENSLEKMVKLLLEQEKNSCFLLNSRRNHPINSVYSKLQSNQPEVIF
ncbi:hypothetical protein YC2023_116829 [Brassica napus]